MEWVSVTTLPMEGRGWPVDELGTPFDRLPARAEGVVREPVWELSLDSAGLAVRFTCDSSEIHARWQLRKPGLAMNHMPATGVSGLDLYVQTPAGWHWLAVGIPQSQEDSTAVLCSDLPPGERQYMLYLPLYNGVESVELGVPSGAGRITAAPPRPDPAPVIFYGTSITQGGCASRPGMAYPAILGRRLGLPTVNLGFSGNGRCEPEVAELLSSLPPPAAFVIDPLPNMTHDVVTELAPGLVRKIRENHPQTPILLVEDRIYASVHTGLTTGMDERNRTNREALQQVFASLKAEGVGNLHLLEAGAQLSDDGEDTVDGSHPTDLGFMRQADAFEAALRPILSGANL